jgi:hypothetical protein
MLYCGSSIDSDSNACAILECGFGLCDDLVDRDPMNQGIMIDIAAIVCGVTILRVMS